MKKTKRFWAGLACLALLGGVGVGVTSFAVANAPSSIGMVKADSQTGSITFGSGKGSLNVKAASASGKDGLGNTWTVTTVGTTSFTPNGSYAQIGAKNSPATSITLSTSLPSASRVTSFSIKMGGFNSTAGDIKLSVDGNEVGSGKLNATDDVTVSMSVAAVEGRELKIEVTNIAKGTKLYSVSYTLEESQTSDTPVTSITEFGDIVFSDSSVPVNTKNAVYASVSVLPVDATESISWSSSDENVAKIAADPVTFGKANIQIVGSGTCTFTVKNKAGNVSKTSSTFTVTEPVPEKKISIYCHEDSFASLSSKSGYAGYDGDHYINGYAITTSDVMTQLPKIQFRKSTGNLYNKTPFKDHIGLLAVKGLEKTISVSFGDSALTENPDVSHSSQDISLGDYHYYVPGVTDGGAFSHEALDYFRVIGNTSGAAKITSIDVVSAEGAALSFSEMYLDALACDSTGVTAPTYKDGYSAANIKQLFQTLPAETQSALKAAATGHSSTYGSDQLGEFGQRYYWVVSNHGVEFDFMGLKDSFLSSDAGIVNKTVDSSTAIVVTIAAFGAVAIGSYFFLRKKKQF